MRSQDFDWPVSQSRFEYTRVSDEEFDRRHRIVREFMRDEGLDALVVMGAAAIQDRAWTNVRWLTNHAGCQLSNAEYVVVPVEEDQPLTLATVWMYEEVPARRARAEDIVDDIRSTGVRAIEPVVERLKELSVEGGTIGVVPVDGDLGIHANDRDRLREEFPETELRHVTREFWELRMIKSDEEIEMIEKSAAIGDRVMESIRENVELGMTESEVFGIAAETMARHGGELPTMILVASTNTYDSDDSKQRMRPVNRKLQKGDTIIQEYTPRYPDGAESQISRPVFLAEPAEEYKEMTELMLEVYDDLMDAIRAGNTAQDLIEAVEPIKEAGYEHGAPVAHASVGGGVSARPLIRPNSDDADLVLEENMVLIPEPAIRTPDHTKGVFICDTVAVTDGEPRRLNDYPIEPIYL